MCFVIRIFLGLYKDNTAHATNRTHQFQAVIKHIKISAIKYMDILPKENNKEFHIISKRVLLPKHVRAGNVLPPNKLGKKK